MPRNFGGLTDDELALFDAQVSTSHHRKIDVDVYRRNNGKAVMSISDKFVGGMIEGDLDRTPITFMECDLIDEAEDLDWSDGEFRQFEVEVTDSRFVAALDDWVEGVVFRGPVWDFERDGAQVHLVAEGPEMNLLGSIRQADVWPAKTPATRVIKELLRRAGALPSDMRIPSLKRRLPKSTTVGVKLGKPPKKGKKDKRKKVQRLSVSRRDDYLTEIEPIAEALDRDFFGNARGVFVLARKQVRPRVQLTKQQLITPAIPKQDDGGDDEDVLTNTWIVTGPNPSGPKKPASAKVTLPETHVNSAKSLGWHGTPRPEIVQIKNKHVKTDRQAKRLGERRRDRKQRGGSTLEVSALPVTLGWRPYSLASVPTEAGRSTSLVRKWQFPLGSEADPLVLGSNLGARTRPRKKGRRVTIKHVKNDGSGRGRGRVSTGRVRRA